MINLAWIEIDEFKGVGSLRCNFDDLTVLVGLNNSGKTSVLEACFLATSSLRHLHQLQRRPTGFQVELHQDFARTGSSIQRTHPFGRVSANTSIRAGFKGGFTVIITAKSETAFFVTVEGWSPELALPTHVAEFVPPPATIASDEDMLSGPDFDERVRTGKIASLWRNSFWWPIQASGGIESFEPVKRLISRQFPDVEILSPTLDHKTSPPKILIKYREKHASDSLDIAQSGAGLRTFLTLARVIEQSSADILLLDEPDSHLHASQQSAVCQLLAELSSTKQVVITTHSPEVLTRVPTENIRWLRKGQRDAVGGVETADLLDHLGVSADGYWIGKEFPSVIIYVEGNDDKPTLEALVKHCQHRFQNVPSAQVIRNINGRFQADSLNAIARVMKESGQHTRVVGIRDLDYDLSALQDWNWDRIPSASLQLDTGKGYSMVTLPFKELENAFLDSKFLHFAYEGMVSQNTIEDIIENAIRDAERQEEWCHQVRHQFRDRMPPTYADSTKDKEVCTVLKKWCTDDVLMKRFLPGKVILRRVSALINDRFKKRLNLSRAIISADELPESIASLIAVIFPGLRSG